MTGSGRGLVSDFLPMGDFAKVMLVGGGGFVGANLRFWVGVWLAARFGTLFPWPTLLVNVTGSFLMGLFLGLSVAGSWHSGWRLLIAVGVLGGYTTFSAFSAETLTLLSGKHYSQAFGYVGASVLGSIGAAWIGLLLGGGRDG